MEVQYRYEPFTLNDIINEKTIKIPQFQRNVVWNSKKRREFVETLRQGNPFGSILVHQDKASKSYSLVDGLQRISTIKHYFGNPFEYFEYTDLDSNIIKELIEHYFKAICASFDPDSEAVIQKCVDIQKSIFNRLKNKEESTHISFELIKEFSLPSDEKSFSLISSVINKFYSDADISKLMVPAIVYTGQSENLPTIFYNLNTGGVNLSKYETFSSLWDTHKYIIDDIEITNKIYDKYDQLREKSDLEVDVSMSEIKDQGITLFEYCYSISEILRDRKKKINILFGTNKKSTDPIGFEILSLIFNLDVNKAEKLGLKESSDKPKGILVGANPKFLVDIKNAIVDTFSTIADSLEYWINAKNGTKNTLDSMYMIYHMAISYFKHNYLVDLEKFTLTSINNKQWNEKYKKYLPLHYLYDYVTDFWKKNRQVADLSRELKNENSLSKYAKNISLTEWDEGLHEFKKNQINDVGNTISLKSKIFIDYLIKLKIEKDITLSKYFDNKSYTIDYEHIVPQKRIGNQLDKVQLKGYPVSSLGNLCYLASTDNRSKKEKTLYEFQDDRPSFVLSDEYLALIDYPSRDDLRFIDYKTIEFDKDYRDYISDRIDNLFSQFTNLIREKYN